MPSSSNTTFVSRFKKRVPLVVDNRPPRSVRPPEREGIPPRRIRPFSSDTFQEQQASQRFKLRAPPPRHHSQHLRREQARAAPAPQHSRLSQAIQKPPKEAPYLNPGDGFDGIPVPASHYNPLARDAYFWAHFYLEQQQNANLQLVFLKKKLERLLNEDGEIAQLIDSYPRIKNELQNFERLKAWGSPSQTTILFSTADYFISLLKLFLDREDVHLVQWTEVTRDCYARFHGKYEKVKAEIRKLNDKASLEKNKMKEIGRDMRKRENSHRLERLKSNLGECIEAIKKYDSLLEISQMQLEIMEKKRLILDHFLKQRDGKSILVQLQTEVRESLAPTITDLTHWEFFGKRCLVTANEITLLLKDINNRDLTKPQKDFLKTKLRQIVDSSQSELEKYKYLLQQRTPTLEEIDKESDSSFL